MAVRVCGGYVCDVRCVVHVWLCLFSVPHCVSLQVLSQMRSVCFVRNMCSCCVWCVPRDCWVVTFCALCVRALRVRARVSVCVRGCLRAVVCGECSG